MTRSNTKTKSPYAKPRLTVYGSVRNLTGGSLNVGNDRPFPAGKNLGSDARFKHNIARIGDHPAGFGIYLFDYKPEFASLGAGRQFGVLAQEVEAVAPEAVTQDENGYRFVNYDMIGITRH